MTASFVVVEDITCIAILWSWECHSHSVYYWVTAVLPSGEMFCI